MTKSQDISGLIERLAAAHDNFAALEGVNNDDLVAVLDAADDLSAAPKSEGAVTGEPVAPRGDGYTADQLARLAFAVYYSSTFCAPENIAAVVKEIDCCPGCEHTSTSGSTCYQFERGNYCPNLLAEDLREISAALYGTFGLLSYREAVWGPGAQASLIPVAPSNPLPAAQEEVGMPGAANVRNVAANVRNEMARILTAIKMPTDNADKEDIISYATEIVGLRVAALRQAPAAPSQEALLRVARLILSVSSVSYDEASNERRAMARAAAEKVIAAFASPQGQESGVKP